MEPTERTWPAFEARWKGIEDNQIVVLEAAAESLAEVGKEFSLQQLDNVGNSLGVAIAELKKLIFYEQTNLATEIGPKPVEEEVIEPVEEVPVGEIVSTEESSTTTSPFKPTL